MSQKGALKLSYGDDGGHISLDGIIAGVAAKYYIIGREEAVYRYRTPFSVKAALGALSLAFFAPRLLPFANPRFLLFFIIFISG